MTLIRIHNRKYRRQYEYINNISAVLLFSDEKLGALQLITAISLESLTILNVRSQQGTGCILALNLHPSSSRSFSS